MLVETDVITVLIVDDQASYRSAAEMVVSLTAGFEVVGLAEDGERGVEMALVLEPDLVLMDINMPGIDGLEATRQIRARSGPPVLIFSTYEASEFTEKALAAGAIGFVSKSDFDPDVLAAAWSAGRPE